MSFKLLVWSSSSSTITTSEKKNDKVALELNYDVITFEFDRSNVDIRIPIAVIEIKCVRKSKQVSNTA